MSAPGKPRDRARRVAPATKRPAWLALHGAPEGSPAEARVERWITLALIAAFAAASLAVALGPHRVGDYFTETDFYGAYAEGARLVQHGHLDPARYGVVGPGYEIALALAGFLVRDLFLAAKLLSILASTTALALWAGTFRRLGGPRLALAATAFIATNAHYFRHADAATTDALALALQAGTLWTLFAVPGARGALLAGALGAFALLTRYNGIYLLPAGLVAITAHRTAQATRGRAAALYALGFAAPVAAWWLYAFTRGGAPAFQLHHNIAFEVYAHARGIIWDEYQRTLQPQFHSLWDVIARDPGAVAARVLFNLWDHLRQDLTALMPWPLGVAVLAGAGLAAWDGSLRRLWPLLAAGALAYLTLVPTFYSERYALSTLPVYAMLAGAAFASPRLALAGARGRLWLKPALALIPLAVAVQGAIHLERRVLSQIPVEALDCAATLRQLSRLGDRVIARKPHVGAIAGVPTVPFPHTTTLGELADYARRERARWLFVSWPEAEMRPSYWYLLDTAGVVPGLTPRRVTSPHPAVLYEIGPGFGADPAWLANDTLRVYHTARAMLLVDDRAVHALLTVGLVERNRGRYEIARRLLERGARLDPNNATMFQLLGDVLLNLHDPAAALPVFERARALAPSSVGSTVGLGWAQLMLGHTQDAASTWREVVRSTHDATTLAQMVKLYRDLGDTATADAAASALAALEGRP